VMLADLVSLFFIAPEGMLRLIFFSLEFKISSR